MYKTLQKGLFLSSFTLLLLIAGITMANAQSIPVTKALKAVTKTFGTHFVYEKSLLEGKETKYNIDHLKGKRVEEVLKGILYPEGLVFLYVKENYYTIIPREQLREGMLSVPRSVNPRSSQLPANTGNSVETQSDNISGSENNEKGTMYLVYKVRNVRGNVKDDSGAPLIGVTVRVVGKNNGTSTNSKGEYSVEVTEGSTLEFSYVGYETKRITISANTSSLNVSMIKNVNQLRDVIISTGYMNKPIQEMTGSAQSISGNDLRNGVTSINVYDMLKGRLSGLYITGNGGDPNSRPTVVQRGYSDFNTGTVSGAPVSAPTMNGDMSVNYGPLIVVDGVITNARSISDVVSVGDIASITQLKDAAATSIYGAQGAQGVIVITTKKGEIGKPKVQVDMSYGITSLPQGKYKLLSTNGYVDMMDNALTSTYEQNLAILQPQYPTVQDYITASFPITEEQKQINTNWYNLTYHNGSLYKTDLSVSGGGEHIRYYVGASYYKEIGNQVSTEMERKSLRANMDIDLSNRLSLSIGLSAIMQTGTEPNYFTDQGIGAYALPYLNPYNQDGTPAYVFNINEIPGNPVEEPNLLFEKQYNNTQQGYQSYLAKAAIKYKLFDWMTLSTTNTYMPYSSTSNNFIDPRSYNGNPQSYFSPNGSLTESGTTSGRFIMSNQIHVNKYFGNNQITGLLGQEFYKDQIINTTAYAYGMEPGSRYLSSARFFGDPTNPSVLPFSEKPFSRAGFSAFGEVNYSYQEKYLATASLRTAASTNFGKNNRYGTFYSLAGGWILSKENFLKDNKALTFLKVRGSYGTSGKEAGADFLNFTFYQLVQTGYNNESSAYPVQLGNPDITWETTNTFNLGLDFSLFDKVNVSVDKYIRRTNNLIQQIPVGSFNGVGQQYRNVAALSNKGMEISIQSTNIDNKRFKWSTNLNITFNKNKIVSVFGGSLPTRTGTGSVLYNLYPGDDIAAIKVIKYIGVDPKTGLPQFEGKGDDGKPFIQNSFYAVQSGANDPFYTIGSQSPKFYGGFNNQFEYKNFSLSILTSFAYGMYGMNPIKASGLLPVYYSNYNLYQLPAGMTVWQKPGDKTALPVINLLQDYGLEQQGSSFIYDDLSHLRIENIKLGYRLNEGLLSKLKMSAATIYISADNVYVFKKKSFFGNDPEGTSLTSLEAMDFGPGMYGQPHKFVFGIQATF